MDINVGVSASVGLEPEVESEVETPVDRLRKSTLKTLSELKTKEYDLDDDEIPPRMESIAMLEMLFDPAIGIDMSLVGETQVLGGGTGMVAVGLNPKDPCNRHGIAIHSPCQNVYQFALFDDRSEFSSIFEKKHRVVYHGEKCQCFKAMILSFNAWLGGKKPQAEPTHI